MSQGKPSGETFEGYKNGEDVPLLSYGVLAATFNLLFALFLMASRVSGRPIPERIDAKDIALLEEVLGESFQDWRSTTGRGAYAPPTP